MDMARIGKVVRKPQFRFGLLVLVPILAWYVLLSFRTNVMAFKFAIIDYNLLHPEQSTYVGLAHFRTIFEGYKLFWVAGLNTLKYSVLINAIMLPLSLVIAYCLANVARGRGAYQWALFLPVVVSMAAVALLFRSLMDPDMGTFNRLLNSVGLPRSRWLTGPKSALPSVVLVDTWKAAGVYIVLLASGLLNIPSQLYDAAKVDGASAFQRFVRITLPLLRHTLTLVVVLVTIGSLQVYVSALILTNGGPGTATTMISQFVVSEAFTNMRFGLASAASLVLFAVILVITMFQLRLMRTDWEY